MKIPLDLSIKIHSVFARKHRPYDICEVADAMISYLTQMLHISADRYRNKDHVWTDEDFEEMVKKRNVINTRVKKLLCSLDDQFFRLNDSIAKYRKYKADLKKKEESKKAKNNEVGP
jgi:hypothetical protein